jgi:hypothetical protein
LGEECLPQGVELTSWQREGAFVGDGSPQECKEPLDKEKVGFPRKVVSLGKEKEPLSKEKVGSPGRVVCPRETL